MPDLVFVYGTLHPDRAPAAIAPTVRRLRPFAHATIQGRLYDLGPYPAVRCSGSPAETVSGELFHLPDDPEVLASLDAYEDFRPDDPAGSLFLRQRTLATLEGGSTRISCWVYVYNHPVT